MGVTFLGFVTTSQAGDMTIIRALSVAPLTLTCPPAPIAATKMCPSPSEVRKLPLPDCPGASTMWKDGCPGVLSRSCRTRALPQFSRSRRWRGCPGGCT
eukprot:1811031-Heterocapsa_arctica.AAC.1